MLIVAVQHTLTITADFQRIPKSVDFTNDANAFIK